MVIITPIKTSVLVSNSSCLQKAVNTGLISRFSSLPFKRSEREYWKTDGITCAKLTHSLTPSIEVNNHSFLTFHCIQNQVSVFVSADCITEDYSSLSADTLYFMAVLNQTLACFERYQQVGSFMTTMSLVRGREVRRSGSDARWSSFLSQGNHTELCRNCKDAYRRLNEIYSQKEKNHTMCIDIEDSVRFISTSWCGGKKEENLWRTSGYTRLETFLSQIVTERLHQNTASDLTVQQSASSPCILSNIEKKNNPRNIHRVCVAVFSQQG